MENTPSTQSPANINPAVAHQSGHHLMMIIFILVAVVIGALALYIVKWSDLSFETEFIQPERQAGAVPEADNLEAQINSTDLGSLEAEFQSIDSDLKGL